MDDPLLGMMFGPTFVMAMLFNVLLYVLIIIPVAVFTIGAGVYFGNKWTKKGQLPGIFQILESNKDSNKKEK